MRTSAITRFAAAVTAAFSFPAHAAPPCGPHAEVAAELMERFGEERAGRGITNDGVLLEIYADPDDGSWTIVMTQPSGLACLVLAGEGWQSVKPQGRPA